jgi:hypothetical protein
MNSFKAKLTNPIDINTIAGGHFRLMPGQYRVTPGQAGRCRAGSYRCKTADLSNPANTGAMVHLGGRALY